MSFESAGPSGFATRNSDFTRYCGSALEVCDTGTGLALRTAASAGKKRFSLPVSCIRCSLLCSDVPTFGSRAVSERQTDFPSDKLSTRQNAGQLRRDKQSRFLHLVSAYSGWLYRCAYWLSGESAAAEDLVQETFLRAWRFLDSLKDENSAKSWLTTI